MTDFFSTMIRLQEDALQVQRAQLDAARKFSNAGGDAIKLQKTMVDATQSGMKAWEATLGFWGLRR